MTKEYCNVCHSEMALVQTEIIDAKHIYYKYVCKECQGNIHFKTEEC